MKKRVLFASLVLASTAGLGIANAESGSNHKEHKYKDVYSDDCEKAKARRDADQHEVYRNVKSETEKLEKKLGLGHDKAYYRDHLEKLGYAITSINANEPDYLEYEIIKGDTSYEVQVDFENGVSNELDVTANFWEAESTSQALENENYSYQYPDSVSQDGSMASDRHGNDRWQASKDRIEKQLGTGHKREYYKDAMKRMGYQITSINVDEVDELEMEVLKGRQSYELEVEFDEETMKSTSVDMKSNFWESEATERAKGEE